MKYYTDIDLRQNELQNAVVHALSSAPTGRLGQIYYNTNEKTLYQYNGTQWVAVGVTYDLTVGDKTGNTVPFSLIGSDGSLDSVNITGAGGATISKSGNTITITTADTDTTYTFTGTASATNYVITVTPSTGTAQTITLSPATATNAGLMSPADYSKLAGIATGAEVNQNAFSRVIADSVSLDADSKTDTLNINAGSNIQITTTPSTDTMTISATDTTYTKGSQAQLETGSDTTGQVWDAKVIHDYLTSVIGSTNAMRFKGTLSSPSDVPTTGVQTGDTYMINTAGTYDGQVCEVGDLLIAIDDTPTWTVAQTNIDGAITSISGTAPISVSGGGSSRTISISNATTSASGAMSASDKAKLENIDVLGLYTYTGLLEAGQTSTVIDMSNHTVVGIDIISVNATIDTNNGGIPVVVDWSVNDQTNIMTISIAHAITDNIYIQVIAGVDRTV